MQDPDGPPATIGHERTLEKGDAIRDGESAVARFYPLLRNAFVDHYRRRAAEAQAR